MPLRPSHPSASGRRPGKILALFALLLPVLLGFLGLVIDAGLLLAAHRQVQNAADAAALAAAQDRIAGRPDATAVATAQAIVQQSDGLGGAAVTVNIPPGQGPYAGNGNYVEVIVTRPNATWFIQALGNTNAASVYARAVAGAEAVPSPEAVVALDPGAVPGLSVTQAALQVTNRVMVNSQGAGFDATGAAVNLGFPSYAVATGTNGTLKAAAVRVVGGVDVPNNILNDSGSGVSPLAAQSLPRSDPFLYLPPPTTANGVVNSYPGLLGQTFASPQDVVVVVAPNQSVSLYPGIYSSITILGAGPGTVTFQPGVYVLKGGGPSGYALNISTGASVTGVGVMFYNTGSDYDVTTGLPDASDGNAAGTDANLLNVFGKVVLNAAQVNFTPRIDPSGPFDGMLFYQRRWNRAGITLQSNSAKDVFSGTLYARWANCTLVGGGAYGMQFLIGSLSVSGPGPGCTVTVAPSARLAKANQVYLVE